MAFKRAVRKELERRKKGWGKHKDVRKARALAFGKSQLAAAFKVLDAAWEKQQNEEILEVGKEINRLFEVKKKGIQFQMDQGRFQAAKADLAILTRSVRGVKRLEQELVAPKAMLKSKAGRKGFKLERIVGPMSPSRPAIGVDLFSIFTDAWSVPWPAPCTLRRVFMAQAMACLGCGTVP